MFSVFARKGLASNIRRNLADEVNRHGIIDTLSWVSQSIADWTVPKVHHPKPVDIALNYYAHSKPPHHIENIKYGHSSKLELNSLFNKHVRTKIGSDSVKSKLTRSRRPPLTAKRKTMPNKRKKVSSSYNYDNLFRKKTMQKHEVIMPSHKYSFPSSRQDLSTAPSKIDVGPTIAEYVLGKIHKLGQKWFS